jgi:hypothetical protein
MPSRVHDRVKETGTVTGTGNITLGGAASGGFKTFASRFTTGASLQVADPIYYCVVDASGNWEVGKGYLSGATTLVRDRVFESSNSDNAVSYGASTAVEVFCTIPAERIEEMFTKGQVYAAARGMFLP